MTHRNSARSCCFGGAGDYGAFVGLLLCFSDIYFAANDDQFILRAMTGFQPAARLIFTCISMGCMSIPFAGCSGFSRHSLVSLRRRSCFRWP